MTPLAIRDRASAALAWLWRQAVPVVAPELPRTAPRAPALVQAPAPPPVAPAPPRLIVERSSDPAELHRYVTSTLRWSSGWLPECVREEIAQEAICRLLERPDIREPRSWLRVTARGLAVDWWRRLGRRPAPELGPQEGRDLLREIEGRELVALLAQAPEHHREVLVRLYLREEGVDALVEAELEARGAGAGDRETVRRWVYSRHRRALAWLRRALEGSEPVPERDQIRERAEEYFQAAGPGWTPSSQVYRDLGPLPVHHLRRALAELRGVGTLEMRGGRNRAEYRLAGGAP